MVRRILCLFGALCVAVTVFSLPVLGALPPNNYVQNYQFKVKDSSLTTYTRDFPTGTIFGIAQSDLVDFQHYYDIEIDLNLVYSTDLYIFRSTDVGFTSSISSYADSSSHYDTSVTVPSKYVISLSSSGEIRWGVAESDYTFDGRVFKFVNPPVGDVNFHFNLQNDWAVLSGMAFGVFIDTSLIPLADIVDSYIDGDMSLSEAMTDLNNAYKDSIAEDPSVLEKQLMIMQYELQRLIIASDSKSIHNTYTLTVPAFNNTINSYTSGSVTLTSALSSLNSTYQNALSAAETPEQGILVNTSYQISLDKLEIQAKQKALDKLDSAVSDEQLTEADDYYAAEEDLIDQFELAEFESALDFELWFNTLPPSETVLYKQFFDYLFNDSSIRMFLIVPISLILVRILMGTHLVLGRGGDHSSKTTVFDSDDHYHFYDDGFRGS